MNTHESYVSLETAKLLKQAGFDWEIDTLYFPYHKNKNEVNQESVSRNWNSKNADPDGYMTISAPTLDVAQKWLREVKGYYVTIDAYFDSTTVFYTVQIIYYNTGYHKTYIYEKDENGEDIHNRLEVFNTYEEAQEAGIKKALEIILEKG